MAPIIVAWIVSGTVCLGCGLLLRRPFALPLRGADDLLVAFWLGWCGVLAVLQIWHLAFPIQWPAAAFIAAAGLAGLWLNRAALRPRTFSRASMVWIAVGLLIAVCLANHSIDLPRHFDSGLYHLSTVRWARSYAVVPGLGNLHGRLAFNQSYFLYAAALEAGPWHIAASHLANGLLLVPLCAGALHGLWLCLAKTPSATPPGLLLDNDPDVLVERGQESHETLEREVIEPTAVDLRHLRLIDAKSLCGLGLVQLARLEDLHDRTSTRAPTRRARSRPDGLLA